ncbi:MAG: hypothetical protein HYY21_04745 [Candidatus Tectomicrobia bacterium]|nr:hypothetical protein [Candidatus Tectomicrobia bacterium]
MLSLWLLAGCGLFSKKEPPRPKGEGWPAPSSVHIRESAGPCPSFLLFNRDQARIEGIWLTQRALPFRMRVQGEQRVLPGLRDVSEVLLVLDDWQIAACKSKSGAKGTERTAIEQKLFRVEDYLRAFTLILSTPYSTTDEAEEEVRKWVKEVRDRLLTELLRGSR